jgi:hypothetical protein
LVSRKRRALNESISATVVGGGGGRGEKTGGKCTGSCKENEKLVGEVASVIVFVEFFFFGIK